MAWMLPAADSDSDWKDLESDLGAEQAVTAEAAATA